MRSQPTYRDERGLTLVEMIIALMIYGIVLAGAIGFVATQNTAFHRGMDRMTALRNLRYAVQVIDANVITLGTNVPGSQPSMVYAGDDVLAFSADFASNVKNDVFAAYIDEDAPKGQVTAPDNKITIPNTSWQWPDTTYTSSAGTRSPAELIVLFFQQDTTTQRTDDYVLWRQVNKADPEIVARNILRATGNTPFFRYFKRTDRVGAPSALDSIPDSSLPIAHTSVLHAVAADTGSSARADSIRAVRVSFRSTNGLTGENERTSEVSRLFAMPNAGFGVLQTCGDEPILGTGLTAQVVNLPGGDVAAQLTWDPATDETQGERDVVRYVIYRQQTPIGNDWGDPFLSIPAGKTSYQYQDQTVDPGLQYRYALAAQDCTPTLSQLTQSATITIP